MQNGIQLKSIETGTKLQSTKQSYIVSCILGEGAFGRVFEAVLENTNDNYAIKIQQKQGNDGVNYEIFKNEITIMRSLTSPNTVNIYDFWEDGLNGYLVMDFIDGGDLQKYMDKYGPLPETKVISFTKQIINGISTMHNHKPAIVHRDLKPENILMTKNELLKIGDLGVSKSIQNLEQQMETTAGTPLFMAPEMLMGNDYDYKCDIYSIGVMVYYMIYKDYPYTAKSHYQLASLLKAQAGKPPPFKSEIQISLQMRDLVTQMLQIEPQKRIPIDKLISHPIFKQQDFNDIYLQDVENQVSDSILANSKTAFKNIHQGIMKQDKKQVMEEVGKLGKMFSNKIKIGFKQSQNKVKDMLDSLQKHKNDQQLILEVINKYICDISVYNILGSSAQSIQKKLDEEGQQWGADEKQYAAFTIYFFFKKLKFLYSELEKNMGNENYKYNQIPCQEKLFVHKLYLKLNIMVKKQIESVDNQIQQSIARVQNEKVNSQAQAVLGFDFPYNNQIIQIGFQNSVQFYLIQRNKLPQFQGDKTKHGYFSRYLHHILLSLRLQEEFQGIDMGKFTQFRVDDQRWTIEERSARIKQLEAQIGI